MVDVKDAMRGTNQLAQEKYEALEAAAQLYPGDFPKMARLGNVAYNTAKKAWHHGLDGRLPLRKTVGRTVVDPGAEPGEAAVVRPAAVPAQPAGGVPQAAKEEAVQLVRGLRANAQMLSARALTVQGPMLELDKALGDLLYGQAQVLRGKWREAMARGEVIRPEELALDITTCLKLHQMVTMSSKRAVDATRALARAEFDLFGPGGLSAYEEAEAAKAKAVGEKAEELRLPAEDVERELAWAAEHGPPELRVIAGGKR